MNTQTELDPELFSLRSATPITWGIRAVPHLHALLLEQAQLEKKAAAAANRFLFVLPQNANVQRSLSQLAREELVHFERTLRVIDQQQIAFVSMPPSRYASQLKVACESHLPQRLVDELLVSALIEARSCERMRCLARALPAALASVAEFYLDLVEAEARHHLVYVEAAMNQPGATNVAERFRMLALHEANTLATLPFTPHLHGGHGSAD